VARRADGEPVDAAWFDTLRSFEARLHWHCHFMQKLEDEPAIEQACVCRPYESLRDPLAHYDRRDAWQAGRTGVPIVDACMRYLHAHGWLPFRMRAMLVSYAAYDLWLDWRAFGPWLARQFVDYEPGIHYSQLQMQSGTTGINTLRIYNPYMQGERFDADGAFIRRWVPELEALPADWIHRPHDMPPLVQAMYGFRVDRDYPAPFVEHAVAVREAKARFAAVQRDPAFLSAARGVYRRHGSRAQGPRARGLLRPDPQSPMP
jgi:deoxyribodipyrimidine photo-lyase